jgi:hypothetical protein
MRNWLPNRKKKLLFVDQHVSLVQGAALSHILIPVSWEAWASTLSETEENHIKP